MKRIFDTVAIVDDDVRLDAEPNETRDSEYRRLIGFERTAGDDGE